MTATATIVSLTLAGFPAAAFDWEGKIRQDVKDLDSPHVQVRRLAVQRLGSYSGKDARRHLLRALDDVDPSVQLVAAKLAADRGYKDAIPTVVRWLSGPEQQLRKAAAATLGKLGGPQVVKRLVRVLKDPEHSVRLKIVAALGEIGAKDAVVPLLSTLNDTNTKVRRAAIDVLAKLDDRRAVLPLMGCLGDSAREVRTAAVTALGKLGDRRAAVAITRLLRDPSTEVVDAAIETLGRLRHRGAAEPLIDLLQTGPAGHRDRAASALARLSTPLAMRALVEALSSRALRPAATRALVASGDAAAPQIAALLQDPRTPRTVAVAAVEIAHESQLRPAVPLLIEQLRIARLPRPLLIDALGKMGDPRAQRPLLDLLTDPSHEIRWAALRALGPMLDERSAEPLLVALRDPVRRIRLLAVRYLGRLKARLAVLPLLDLVKSPDRYLARVAARAVAQVGDPRAVPELIRLLRHPDRQLRQLAIAGLARATTQSAVADLLRLCHQSSGATRVACIQALGAQLRGRSHEQATKHLQEVLHSNDHSAFLAAVDSLAAMRGPRIPGLLIGRLPTALPRFRPRLAEVLGNYPDSRALITPVLVGLLSDDDLAVRGGAAWALAKLGGQASLDSLMTAARQKGWSSRINATAALASSRAGSAIASLRELAGDADPYVRANAVLGLGWAGARGSLPSMIDRLQNDLSPWVRVNALRAVRHLQPASVVLPEGNRFDSIERLSAWIRESDPDSRVRHAVESMSNTTQQEPRDGSTWIGLYLLDRSGNVLRDERFVLVTPDGLVKAGISDSRGQAWEEGLSPGRCFVELPAPELDQIGPR